MMHRTLLPLCALLLSLTVQAADLNQVVAERSQLTFVFKEMNVPVEGRFKKFDAQVSLDAAKPEAGKARIEVDLASVDAGSSDANDTVKDKPWFNTAAFPKASFVAGSIKSLGGGRYEVRGPLTIKGIGRDTTATFTLRSDASGTWIEGGFILPRLQFKIGEGEWADTDTVADAVQVKFKLLLVTKK
jgi:polyisoprenoid-binding protein YceI